VEATVAPLEDEVAALFRHDPRILADPFPLYKRLREEQPAFRFGDRVLITRHREAHELLSSPAIRQGLAAKGSRYRRAIEQLPETQQQQMAEMFQFYEQRLAGVDGEHHTRLRKLASRAFSPRTIAALEESVQATLDMLLEPIVARDDVEFVSEVAYHLPLIVIAEMLDIPIEDRGMLRLWANDLGRFVGADWGSAELVARTHQSVFNLKDYLAQHFGSRRGKATGSLLGGLLAAGEDGDRFTEDELVAMVTQLIFAGHETTTNFIGNSLVLLLGGDHRRQWDALRDDPSLIPDAIEELIRHQTPTQYVDKLAAEEFEVAGTSIRQWDTISVFLAAANRDPEVFDDAETFDLHRRPTSHLSFGFGAHFCLGAALARLEALVVLRTITQRFPDIRLVDPVLEWQANHMIRGPKRLLVATGPEAR
jgi:cytochrome P450